MSRKSVQVNGVVYDSVKSCCKDLGFCITGVRNFMNKNGIDCIEDGLVEYKMFKDKLKDTSCIGTPIEVNGVLYPSFKSCCVALDVSLDCVYRFKKLNNIDSMTDAILGYKEFKEFRDSNKAISIDGVVYSSVSSYCDTFGINPDSIWAFKRYHSISSIETAILQYRQLYEEFSGKKGRRICIDGVNYPSIKSCCESLGFSYAVVHYFMVKYDIKDIVDAIKLYSEQRSSFEFNGVLYKTLKDCCRSLGINEATVSTYSCHYGISIEKSIKLCVERKKESGFRYNNVVYSSKMACCKELNIRYGTVSKTLRKYGLSFTESLDVCYLYSKLNVCNRDRCKIGLGELFTCSCKRCGKEFVFTRELAFKHIKECKSEDLG